MADDGNRVQRRLQPLRLRALRHDDRQPQLDVQRFGKPHVHAERRLESAGMGLVPLAGHVWNLQIKIHGRRRRIAFEKFPGEQIAAQPHRHRHFPDQRHARQHQLPEPGRVHGMDAGFAPGFPAGALFFRQHESCAQGCGEERGG